MMTALAPTEPLPRVLGGLTSVDGLPEELPRLRILLGDAREAARSHPGVLGWGPDRQSNTAGDRAMVPPAAFP
jgi:hypothetical protein